ncbi:MAG: hypothetical protein AB7D38_02315 [Sulfurimonas sp.]
MAISMTKVLRSQWHTTITARRAVSMAVILSSATNTRHILIILLFVN